MIKVDPEELGRIVTVLAQKGYVNAPAAAKVIGVHRQTLDAMFERGEVRWFFVGKRKCVTFDELKRIREEGNYTVTPSLESFFDDQ